MLNRVPITLVAIFFFSCAGFAANSGVPPKAVQSAPVDKGWWMERHEKRVQQAASGKDVALIFIGDSITQQWERSYKIWNQYYRPYGALNLGFSGDRTENVLWRLQNGEIKNLSPRVAVILIGTNNTGHRQDDPADTALGIRKIIDLSRAEMPETKILLLGIFPRGAIPDDPKRVINRKINALIKEFADNEHVYYLNINDRFLENDGTLSKKIMPDLLHLSEEGYQIWADAMKPLLTKLMTQQ